ncbi:DUF5753 domain-containing protein [Streptomyces tubercidicus]|uniref:DUF5753 domain-containing protein n=1 Tax=Streptomyces tubercidicus TaxID=47759 RepID=UPI003464F946
MPHPDTNLRGADLRCAGPLRLHGVGDQFGQQQLGGVGQFAVEVPDPEAVAQRPAGLRCASRVTGEAALRLQVGGRQAMRKQLEHLESMAGHPSVEVQVIPDRAGAHAGLSGSFVLFGFPNPTYSDVVCIEHRTGTLYMETQEETAEYTLIFDSLR